ncbi:hypothetical protein ASPZODRAFT_140163 [Penicilliopsis zonata CBS 506.65]|uniref:rRNA methyltransferase 1, mitochondrial n=1 Tax=Penicilliopsis zonata CBS 506.65 TaxID=1073090 RepID=A0A1L9SPV2_9EURO|nr:hypothetical protein ASPZODRAFT_140163 [Penicilliopsis zonata CBS 506.65]OJJ49240.1 hypothetical protein ASPZODRAFT_140163 [Penicilliopsis zonata CBS 506.65]
MSRCSAKMAASILFPSRQLLAHLEKGSNPLNSVRYASLTSAISRGIRRSQPRPSFRPSRRSAADEDRPKREPRPQTGRSSEREKRWPKKVDFDAAEFVKSGRFVPARKENPTASPEAAHRKKPSKEAPRHHRATDTMPERIRTNVRVPESIPYSSPASEFIYGASAIEAALRCGRRKLWKLYLYQAADEELGAAKVALRKLALTKNIPVKMVFAGWDRLLDKMSAGRPHNGCVLEASPLPCQPVRSFAAVPSTDESHFSVVLAPQSREEAAVNGTNSRIAIVRPQSASSLPRPRYPFALLLDGVVDPGNVGAIIRSAYYLGIDAVIFAGRNSAPLSPVTIKASAGAAENMTLLRVSNEVAFIQESRAQGWKFYAADAPQQGSATVDLLPLSSGAGSDSQQDLLAQSPTVLMLGSEGTGLSHHIKSHADAIVSIPGTRLASPLGVDADPARVDSLNVSVAAALLMDKFLGGPLLSQVRSK